MTTTQAKAEIFWTAFRSLKRNEREAIIEKILKDKTVREDLRYALVIEDRKNETGITLDEYLSRRNKK